MNHQLASYCFFKYITEYAGDKPPSDIEIASLNSISVETVKQTEKRAIVKLAKVKEFADIKEAYKDESPYSETDLDKDYKIFR